MASDRGQLPVWDTGFKAYWFLLQYVWIYLGQFALLFGALLGLGFAIGLIAMMAGADLETTNGTRATELLGGLLGVLGVVSICVGCHRAILLGGQPRLLDLFRFRLRELRYLGVWIATMAAILVPIVLSVLVLMQFGGRHWPIFGIALAWIGFIGPVLALAFPAAAIDRPQSLRASIRLGRGHRLRLLGVLVVVHLPLMLLAFVLGLMAEVLGEIALTIVQAFLQFCSTLAMVAATSVAYEAIAGQSRSDVAAVFD